MDEQNINVNKYITWVREGKSFSDVRQDLTSQGLSEEHIKDIITKLDDKLLDIAMNSDQGFTAQKSDKIGKICLAIGSTFLIAFVFIHSYTILGIGGAFISAGVTFLLMAKKLVKGNGSVFEKSNTRKLNLRKNRESE